MKIQKHIPDNPNREEFFDIYGFFILGSKYFTIKIKDNNKIKVELSNFVGESLFHLTNGTNNSKRIIKLQRNTGENTIIEIQSSEMKLDSFETILKSKQCTFYGNTYQLKRIFANWMDNEIEANILETLGYNAEHDVYVFSNAIFTAKNKLLEINDVGIVDDPESEKKYYLPAFGLAHINNQDYEGERKFQYIPGKLNFEQWAKLYFEAFETNGAIAILFLILSAFWDVVFSQVGFFPFLFLFGAYGTGKTKLTEFLLRVFGKDYLGIPLNNATQVGLTRAIASRNNSIFYLKEYTPETDESNQDLILTAYDGSGRVTGIKTNDNKTRIAAVKSAIIFDGNNLPAQKTAVLSRMILLNFDNNKFTDKQQVAYKKLSKIQDSGFGKVLTDILKQREFFKNNFKQIYDENVDELKKELKANFSERTLNHVALILIPAKLFFDKLKLPFTFTEITRAVVENAIQQNNLLKQTDEITVFWVSFAYGLKNNTLIEFKKELENVKNSHYNLKITESGENILQIKLQSIYPEYVRYCKNNNQRYLDSNSLRMLLTSKSYAAFIPNRQKSRGAAYTDLYFGSCYQFLLENSENVFSINEIEINM
ncbi:MAG: DUF927 domain-containing protein [Draconibacterium sp.]|nr:DUF927 domain-containing protein [Draconibacterium sp.]